MDEGILYEALDPATRRRYDTMMDERRRSFLEAKEKMDAIVWSYCLYIIYLIPIVLLVGCVASLRVSDSKYAHLAVCGSIGLLMLVGILATY